MVPRTLEEWNIDSLRHLLDNKYFELESFDYKSQLPHPKDDAGKKRLADSCAAFANSNGGFLVFGIADNSRLPTDHRLEGIDSTLDFPNDFGNFPAKCKPTVAWDFKNPPIKLPERKVIHIVYIPRSWQAPHCINEPEEGLLFPKRTNKGTEYLSVEEIRTMFLGYHEKQVKLHLLFLELGKILEDAEVVALIGSEQLQDGMSTASFRLDVLESVLVEVYTIIAANPELLKAITDVRKTCQHVNNRITIFLANLSFRGASGLAYKNHNEEVRDDVKTLLAPLKQAMTSLTPLIEQA